MFWSFRENLGGLAHSTQFLARKVLGFPVDFHITRLQAKGIALTETLDDFNKPLTCRFCGFAIMSYRTTSGYRMTCCSSFAEEVLADRERLDKFTQELTPYFIREEKNGIKRT